MHMVALQWRSLMTDLKITDIKNLLKAGESETVEFKKSFNDDVLEAIGAFSNARGGVVLIGIQDSGKICGFQIGKKTIEDIANRIQEATDPRIQPSISVFTFEYKKILAIQVARSNGIPISIRGRFYKRTGKNKQRMSHEEIMQRITTSTGLSWDAQAEPGASLNDLDFNLISSFIEAANKLGRRPIPQQTTLEESLRKLELIKDGTPTRAALLLFGENPDSYFSSAFLKIGRFRSPTIIVDDREVHGSLIQQLNETMAWFRDRLTTEFIITGKPEREVRWEYPLDAIREAVINVLCHRDFVNGAHSQIRLYDDRLEFWNAGSLPSPLTPEILFEEHDSIPRNRKIAEVFYYMGFIERWGSGTLRIAEALEKSGLPKPEFISEPGCFKLILYKPQLTDKQLKKMGLSERQMQAITYVREHGIITNSEYQSIANVSKSTATRDLNVLKEKDIFIFEGITGRGTVYKLKGS